MYGNYRDQIAAYWGQMRMAEHTRVVVARYGNPTQEDVNRWYATGDPRGPAIGKELQDLHAEAFHKILSLLHHHDGHHDVGAARKPGGQNWHGLAEDVVCLKPLDGNGPTQIVDAVGSLGGVNPQIVWAVLDPNPERTWVQPAPPGGPVPGPVPVPPPPGPQPVPPPPPAPTPGLSYDQFLALMRDLSDVYGPHASHRAVAEVIAHWSWGMLAEGRTEASVRQDARDRGRPT